MPTTATATKPARATMIQSAVMEKWPRKTMSRPVTSSTPYAGLAIRSSMNLIPLRAKIVRAASPDDLALHTP